MILKISSALLWMHISIGAAYEFHRTTTGVTFSPYVKHAENGVMPPLKQYSLNEVMTMLSLVSTKFSKITTVGVGTESVEYVRGKTYFESMALSKTAEAAAQINKRSRQKKLTVLIGIWQEYDQLEMFSELRVAIESAEIANSIFPGTVEGLVLSQSNIGEDLDRARQTLDLLKYVKRHNLNTGLSLGTRQNCDNFGTTSGELGRILSRIAREADFIICEDEPANHRNGLHANVEHGVSLVANNFLRYREHLLQENPSLQVMGETGWATKGAQRSQYETVEKMGEFWKLMDAWGFENNFTVWMHEAFDQPWKTSWASNAAHYGWWKLKPHSRADEQKNYLEKTGRNNDEKVSIPSEESMGYQSGFAYKQGRPDKQPKTEESTFTEYYSTEGSDINENQYQAEKQEHEIVDADGEGRKVMRGFIWISVALLILFVFPGVFCMIYSAGRGFKNSKWSPNELEMK